MSAFGAKWTFGLSLCSTGAGHLTYELVYSATRIRMCNKHFRTRAWFRETIDVGTDPAIRQVEFAIAAAGRA